MSTADQTHSARLHGEALLAAQAPMFQTLIDRLTAEADGRDDLRVETAGLIAGWWFGSPDTEQGHELIAVGLLLLAGPVDGDLLVHWVRTRRRAPRPLSPVLRSEPVNYPLGACS